MRKQELDNWVENGGELPDELTEDEKSYLQGLGWSVVGMRWYNGLKLSEHNCLHGEPHGKQVSWHENGQKWYEYNYLNGGQHGKQVSWHENGQKDWEYHYHHGKLHGVYKGWYENGQKDWEYHHHHGKLHGVREAWKDDGTLYKHEEYAYGILLKDHLKEET